MQKLWRYFLVASVILITMAYLRFSQKQNPFLTRNSADTGVAIVNKRSASLPEDFDVDKYDRQAKNYKIKIKHKNAAPYQSDAQKDIDSVKFSPKRQKSNSVSDGQLLKKRKIKMQVTKKLSLSKNQNTKTTAEVADIEKHTTLAANHGQGSIKQDLMPVRQSSKQDSKLVEQLAKPGKLDLDSAKQVLNTETKQGLNPAKQEIKSGEQNSKKAKLPLKLAKKKTNSVKGKLNTAKHKIKISTQDANAAKKGIKPAKKRFRVAKKYIKLAKSDAESDRQDIKQAIRSLKEAKQDLIAAKQDLIAAKQVIKHAKKNENAAEKSDNSLESAAVKFVKHELQLPLKPQTPGECPPLPDKLKRAKIKIKLWKPAPTWTQLMAKFPRVKHGGWSPTWCRPNQRLAILVPYRDRESDLRYLLNHLHTLLPLQALEYRIFLGEMAGRQVFKKGVAMNALYKESMRLYQPTCLIFHDVDVLAEVPLNLYRCGRHPRVICTSLNKFYYSFIPMYFGGAVAVRPEEFEKANGFSNRLAGWGSEDDLFRDRLDRSEVGHTYTPPDLGRFSMTMHPRDPTNLNNDTLRTIIEQQEAKKWKLDGLNNVQYNVTFSIDRRLFHHLRFVTRGVELRENVTYSLLNLG